MPAWVAPLAIQAGSSILSALFGGGGKKITQELSPEAKQLYQLLLGQYQGGTPSWIGEAINPQFDVMRNLTRQTMTQQGMGQSGNLISALMNVEAKRGREIGIQTGQYKSDLARMLASIVGGTGTQTAQSTFGQRLAPGIEGLGESASFLMGLMEAMKEEKAKPGSTGLDLSKLYSLLNPSYGQTGVGMRYGGF